MGAMFCSVAMLFTEASDAVNTDEAMSLFKGRFPASSLMFSMTLATMPKLRRTSAEVTAVAKANTWLDQDACLDDIGESTLEEPKKRSNVFSRAMNATKRQSMRLNTMLDVSIDDSVMTANSIRARGWGDAKRTSFKRHPLRTGDLFKMMLVVIVGAGAATACCISTYDFSFYPSIDWPALSSWYSICGYVLVALYTIVGFIGVGHE